jgi:hypothetical protein
MQELDSPVMVIIREHDHISPHVVHDHRETLKHGIYGLTREMSEVLVLSLVGRKEPRLNLSILGMSILQPLPNPSRQILCPNSFEFGFTQRTVQVVDRLVVGVEHVPRSWRKEVQWMNIRCVHHDIPHDLTLARGGKQPSAFATYGSSYHQSMEDPNPVPGTPSLDLRLVRITKIRNRF